MPNQLVREPPEQEATHDRASIHELVDQLPESELLAAHRYLKYLWYESNEDGEINSVTAAKLRASLDDPGENISLEEAKRRLGL